MSKFRFELNKSGVAELLKSSEMMDVLNEYARQVAGQAGSDYTSKVMPTRAVAFVEPKNEQGVKDNLENNTLLKAVHR